VSIDPGQVAARFFFPRFARRGGLQWPALLLLFLLVLAAGCGASLQSTPTGAVMGRANLYDYSPSVILSGTTEQFWWCGMAPNPNNPSQLSDTIQYGTLDTSTGKTSQPITVLGETPGAWDSAYTCNAQVVRGLFADPIGDGRTYSYAMYYVGTNESSGLANSIGVAFSNDGIHWAKYPQPIIETATQTHYGVGQPAPYNSDGKAGIWLFYEDSNGPTGAIHKEATSTDGVHFQIQGTLTTNGLNANDPLASWGNMAFDPVTGYWYAAFNTSLRQPWTTGNSQERGQPGVRLYRIPSGSLLSGATPWQELRTFDTSATGSESNFIAGFLRDGYGNLNVGPYPSIELFTSMSNPTTAWDASGSESASSADPTQWDIGVVKWTPDSPLLPLNRYKNASAHETTTGWIDPEGGFSLDKTLGYLYESPQNEGSQTGATLALYSCKSGTSDYYVSADATCGSNKVIGLEGYGWAQPPAAASSVPLYSCAMSGTAGTDNFVSSDAQCEGQGKNAGLLGYAAAEN
jgi:hypothetical protein